MQLLSCRSRRGVGQSARRFVQQNALRTRDHQVQGLGRSDELLRPLPSFPKVRWTRPHIVSVSRQNVHDPLLQHPLGPIARPPAEAPAQRARGDLHPNAVRCEPLDHLVLGFNPGQPLWMGEDGHVSRQKNIEEQVFQAGRRDMVRRFGQRVSRVAERQQMAALEAAHEVRNDVIVGSRSKLERDTGVFKPRLKPGQRFPNAGPCIVIQAGQDMRGTSDAFDTLFHIGTGHRQRSLQIGGSVVDTWK